MSGFKLFNTSGNTPITFTAENSQGIIPNMSGPLTAAQLANLNSNNFGWQAAPNGQQTGIQSAIYNKPTFNPDGTGIAGGLNFEGIGNIMSGLGSVAQIFSSLKAMGLAEDQLDFQKSAFNTNLKNQTKSYNTALEDRTRSRYHSEGRTSSDVDNYLAKHSI